MRGSDQLKWGVAMDKPKLSLPKAKKLSSPPTPSVPADKPYAVDLHSLVAEELVRAANNKAVALDAVMKRITGDDDLLRRFAIPMLQKKCIKHIKSVLRTMDFQRAVAKAVEARSEDEDEWIFERVKK
jgi:hypothetical protein